MSTGVGSDNSPLDIKQIAHRLIDALPAGASWDDLIYVISVRQCIEAGLADANAGRLTDVDAVRREFGLGAAEAANLR